MNCSREELYGKDILFQKSELKGRHVAKGDTLDFNVVEGRTGPIAVGIGSSNLSDKPMRPVLRLIR